MSPVFYHLLLLYLEMSPVRILMLMNPEFLKNIFKKCEPFFKVFIEFVTILLLFHVLVFSPERHMRFNLSSYGIKPILPASKNEVLTTGRPGKSLLVCFYLL